MQKNRNKYLAIALGLMIVSSLGLLFLTREEPKSEIDHNHFRLAESEKIDQVILSSPRGKINLKFGEIIFGHGLITWDFHVVM